MYMYSWTPDTTGFISFSKVNRTQTDELQSEIPIENQTMFLSPVFGTMTIPSISPL